MRKRARSSGFSKLAFNISRSAALTTLFLSSLLYPASGQRRGNSYQNVTRGTFELGMKQEEAAKRLGSLPRGTYHYIRRSNLNEYEIRLEFGRDDSESRLHPVTRLKLVEIKLDRARPARAVLADTPEGVELCAQGCSLLGVVTDPNSNYEPHIIAYPVRPTPEQLHLAAMIGTNWRPEAAKTSWVPAVIMRWETHNDPSYPPVDWLNQPIETASFTAVAPAIELMRGTARKPLKCCPDHPSVELGVWTSR